MVFTTQIFLFVFMPICLLCFIVTDCLYKLKAIGSFLRRLRIKELIIIAFSLVFYAWSCFDDVVWLLGYAVIIFLLASLISYSKSKNNYLTVCTEEEQGGLTKGRFYLAAIPFALSVIAVVSILVCYNYSGFLGRLTEKFVGGGVKPICGK